MLSLRQSQLTFQQISFCFPAGNESSSEDEKEVTLSQANSNSTFTPQSYSKVFLSIAPLTSLQAIVHSLPHLKGEVMIQQRPKISYTHYLSREICFLGLCQD